MKISIVIPTYNERENIENLVRKIYDLIPNIEVVIVDDNSKDGTVEIVERLSKLFNVKVLRRKKKRGIASAALDGFRIASGDIIGCMDADFSHPPEVLPRLIKPFKNDADLVIGSRYIEGGGSTDWSLWRMAVSRGATLMSKIFTSMNDPMSGFFFFRRKIVNINELSAISCKICFEVLVKGKYNKVVEVPYIYMTRQDGKSKLTPNWFYEYLILWFHMVIYKVFRCSSKK